MGSYEGKILPIFYPTPTDFMLLKIMNFDVNFNKSVLGFWGSPLGCCPLKSKIGPVVFVAKIQHIIGF